MYPLCTTGARNLLLFIKPIIFAELFQYQLRDVWDDCTTFKRSFKLLQVLSCWLFKVASQFY